tara:strand:+ start:530 stop:721 length:192 start_codon:yes stop_codon:yes gene_type:complete
MRRTYIVIGGKVFTRTYAESVKHDMFEHWEAKLREDGWTHFEQLQRMENGEIVWDIYAWRKLE